MSPALSKAQRIAMAIAENEPKKLYKRNKRLLKMSKGQLHDFASTPESALPQRVKKKKVAHAQKGGEVKEQLKIGTPKKVRAHGQLLSPRIEPDKTTWEGRSASGIVDPRITGKKSVFNI